MASWVRSRRCCGQLVKIKEVMWQVGQDQGGAVASWLRLRRCCGQLVKIKEVLWPVG